MFHKLSLRRQVKQIKRKDLFKQRAVKIPLVMGTVLKLHMTIVLILEAVLFLSHHSPTMA